MHRPLTFDLLPIALFSLEFTVWALRRRRQNEIDRWDGTTYRRLMRLQGRVVEIGVREMGSREAPRLAVSVAGERMTPSAPTCAQVPRSIRSGFGEFPSAMRTKPALPVRIEMES